jgi:hypothetical protein
MPRTLRRLTCSTTAIAATVALAMSTWAPALHGAPSAPAHERSAILQRYGQLPLSFEPNRGQTDARVDFVSRGPGYTLFLGPGEATLALNRSAALSPAERNEPAVLRMQWVGARLAAAGAGRHALPGRMHYFRGRDAKGWTANVPTYRQVAYDDVYPGIDVVYYGNQQQLEYDFVVAPGGNPASIAFRFHGASRLEIDAAGALAVDVAGETVRLHPPMAYQADRGARHEVASRYVIEGGGTLRTGHAAAATVSVHVGDYDRSRTLVIDPILSYSTFLGGSAGESGRGIAVDGSGSAYVTGLTSSLNFPTPGGAGRTSAGDSDVFVAKLSPDGSALLYSVFLGGAGADEPAGIAVDTAGGACVTGRTFSNDFPVLNAIQATNGGGFGDGFVARLDAAGALVYATYLGGDETDDGRGVALDAAGSAYVTGSTLSHDFPITSDALRAVGEGAEAYVSVFGPSGALVYSSRLGGRGNEYGEGIAVDAFGGVYVVGETGSDDFPAVNAVQAALLGVSDAFVTKLEAGGSISYSTYLGGGIGSFVGPASTSGFAIAVDESGSAYVTGLTSARDFPTAAPLQPALNGAFDSFVSKLSPSGTLAYSTYLGGGRGEVGRGIAVDAGGNAYVAGETSSADFPVVRATQAVLDGFENAFVVKLDPAGAAAFSSFLGGGFADQALAVATDVVGNAYVTGLALSADFPTVNALQPGSGGESEAFVTKIDLTANDPPTAAPDAYEVAEDTPLTVAAPGVLGNDTDLDSAPLTAVLVAAPANGALSLSADGGFTYVPRRRGGERGRRRDHPGDGRERSAARQCRPGRAGELRT